MEDAFFGAEIDIEFERIAKDESCMVEECPFCKGKKYLRRKSSDVNKRFMQKISTPCPVCLGLGVTSVGSCSPYISSKHSLRVAFPAGTRPDYEITLSGYGNAVLKGLSFVPGDLKVVVEKVGPETDYVVSKSGVSLTVYLTPEEALNGFVFEKKYVDQMLRIDRSGKLTIPGAVVRIAGGGFPILGSRNNVSVGTQNIDPANTDAGTSTSTHASDPISNTSTSSPTSDVAIATIEAYSQIVRDDLLIIFELKDDDGDEEEEEEEGDTEDISNADDGNPFVSFLKRNGNSKTCASSSSSSSSANNGDDINNDSSSEFCESNTGATIPSSSGSGPIHISSQEDFDKIFGSQAAKRKSIMTRNMLLILKKKFGADSSRTP
jgi:hypothetical protein